MALTPSSSIGGGGGSGGVVQQGARDATAQAWLVDGSAVTQPVSGTVTANQGGAPWSVSGTVTANQGTSPWVTNDPGLPDTLGQKTMANSTGVAIASDQSAVPVSAAALPLPAGAATEATLATMSALVAKMNANLNDVAFAAAIWRDLQESGATG